MDIRRKERIMRASRAREPRVRGTLNKELAGLNQYDRALVGKPSVLTPCCAVCGKPWTNEHHVIFKGAGGVPRALERKIPRIRLCGNGNVDGCHGLAHHRRLFFRWSEGGWEYLKTSKPISLDEAMETPDAFWMRLTGRAEWVARHG